MIAECSPVMHDGYLYLANKGCWPSKMTLKITINGSGKLLGRVKMAAECSSRDAEKEVFGGRVIFRVPTGLSQSRIQIPRRRRAFVGALSRYNHPCFGWQRWIPWYVSRDQPACCLPSRKAS
jgi:hypothetical protein